MKGLALLLLALPTACLALQYVHDELLWTKQSWNEYKLPFPWSAAMKQRDPDSTTRQLQDLPVNSLNGPLLDGEAIAKLVEEDARKGPGLQQSSFDLSLLDEDANLAVAATVAQCKVCGTLAKLLWEGLTHWVNLKHQVPNKKHIASYAQDLCEYEVPNEVLDDWVLLRARVQQARGLPFVLEGQMQEFYMLSQRAKQHAQPKEIEAVRRSCQQLLKDDEAGKEKPQLLHLASSMVHKYYRHLAQRLNKGHDEGVVEAVDDGPVAQRECYNKHPQCGLWREKGECESNAQYMLGDEGVDNGWCRLACGKCAVAVEQHSLSADDAAAMRQVQSDLLSVLQSKACVTAAPCKWAAGDGMQQLLAKAGKGAGKEAAVLMESAEFISGPVHGADKAAEEEAEMAVDENMLASSRPMLARALSDAVVGDTTKGRQNKQPPEKFTTDAGKALWEALGTKCHYINTGWWMYEVCFCHHISQFHLDDKQKADWVISLGRYQSSDWQITTTHMTGLYPHGSVVPYVSQEFGNGNDCELDEPEDSASASSSGRCIKRSEAGKCMIKRRTELRLMCSPDLDLHIIIKEPEQCIYIVEMYVPQLCTLNGFAVEVPKGARTAAKGHAALLAAQQSGGGSGQAGEEWGYYEGEGEDEDDDEGVEAGGDEGEDDPYLDPADHDGAEL